MNKQEIIEELKKREQNNRSLNVPFNEGYRGGISFALELAKQLDEPKSELIEVPSMIAKFIKENSDPIFEICAWSDHYGSDGRTCDDPELSVVLDWYGSNTKEFYEAVLNGYTVKQEPKWVVKFEDAGCEFYFTWWSNIYKTNDNPLSPDGHTDKTDTTVFKFTDKAKAEAVATLVEGSVEEV